MSLKTRSSRKLIFGDGKTEKLIESIRSNPVVYDHSSNDNALKSNIWQKIAEEVGDESITVNDCKHRWRNLRDVFVRSLRTRDKLIQQGSPKGIKWQYFDSMLFLEPYIDMTRTEVSVQPAEEDLRNCEDLFATPNDSSSESVALEEETADEKSSQETLSDMMMANIHCKRTALPSVEDTPMTPKQKRKKKDDSNLFGDSIENLLQIQKCTQEILEKLLDKEEESDDVLYFKSCIQRMKELSIQQRGWIKMKISEIFFIAENKLPVHCEAFPSVIEVSQSDYIEPDMASPSTLNVAPLSPTDDKL